MSIIKNKFIWIPAVILLLVLTIFVFGRTGLGPVKTYTVQSGAFEMAINTKGEIQGKNAVIISVPDVLKKRDLHIWNLKIKDMVAEGTSVKKGDWVATLDATTLNQQMQSNNQELTRKRAEFSDAKIDSAIQLTKLREELNEFKYDLAYKKLELEQAKYESPAYQRKKEVEYNKTIRMMDKKRRDYEIKRLDLKTKTKRIEDRYNYTANRDKLLKEGVQACRVKAPRNGMVMYAKLWGGRKLRVGDDVGRFNPTIATLPDMSVLVSETYVQEIDITKIELGDSVVIAVDALPNNKYTGKVSKIANIGQELSGFDTKVFRVLISVNEQDKKLKPSMTTENSIVIQNIDEAIKIPREYIFGSNGESYVFLKKDGKIQKKRVQVGMENEEEILIKTGLQENDKILTSIPENADEITYYEG